MHRETIHQIPWTIKVTWEQKENEESPETKLQVMEDSDLSDRIRDCSYVETQQYTRKLRQFHKLRNKHRWTKGVLY